MSKDSLFCLPWETNRKQARNNSLVHSTQRSSSATLKIRDLFACRFVILNVEHTACSYTTSFSRKEECSLRTVWYRVKRRSGGTIPCCPISKWWNTTVLKLYLSRETPVSIMQHTVAYTHSSPQQALSLPRSLMGQRLSLLQTTLLCQVLFTALSLMGPMLYFHCLKTNSFMRLKRGPLREQLL